MSASVWTYESSLNSVADAGLEMATRLCFPVAFVGQWIYLRTKERAGVSGRFAMATGLLAVTVAMGVGVFAATIGIWLPHI